MSLSDQVDQRKLERGISRSEDGRSRALDLASSRMTIAVCDFRVIARALEDS